MVLKNPSGVQIFFLFLFLYSWMSKSLRRSSKLAKICSKNLFELVFGLEYFDVTWKKI